MSTFTPRQFLETAGIASAIPALDAAAGRGSGPQDGISVEKKVVFGKGGALAFVESGVIGAAIAKAKQPRVARRESTP